MRKATIILILFTILAKTIGFGRDIILSYVYGASNISDAYLVGFTVPGIIFAFIGVGIATSYIPIYSDIERNKDVKSADIFTNNMISLLIILCTILIIIGLIFSAQIVRILAIGFDKKTMDLAVSFTRISMFGIGISVMIHIFSSYLNIKNNFHAPAFMGIPYNIFIIISIILSAKINIILLPTGIIIALMAQLIFLVPFIKKEGFEFRFKIDLKDSNLRALMLLSLPVVLGVSVNQINVLVDRTIASQLAVGGMSALNYASRLNIFIQDVFVMSFATTMYPLISKMAAAGNLDGLKKLLAKSILGINLLVLPTTIGTMIFTEQIVNLLFGRGAFDTKALVMTSNALLFFSIGMIGFGIREVLSRAFYSIQDTKTPMKNAAIAMILNIVLNIILSRYLGVSGLALATSISAIFCTGLLFISLRKKIGPLGMKNTSISFIKILFASIFMGLIAKLSFEYLNLYINQNIALGIAVILGILIYFTTIYTMKIEDVDIIIVAMKRKLQKNNLR